MSLIHEQTGLRIVKNPKNHFVVVTLHYTADPGKRSPEWISEARAGLSPAKWSREYEIEYFAMMGEPIFPEFKANKDSLVLHPPYPEINVHASCWGGFDYGARNPSSFHVYTIQEGVVYSVWELFEPCRNISEFSAKMRECPYWGQLKYIAADPTLWAKDQQTRDGNVTSIHQVFWDCGIRKLTKGITDEAAFVAKLHELWKDLTAPKFFIFDCCPNQIRELESAVYVSMSEKQLLSRSYKETMLDKDNHSLDDMKYFFNSQPTYKQRTITLPNLAKMWKK